MNEIFREQTIRVKLKKFIVIDGGVRASITVDVNGNPEEVCYDSLGRGGGGYIMGPNNPRFEENLRSVMETILDLDVDEFRSLRNTLSPKYKAMAESVRKSKLSSLTRKYDF